MNKPLIIFGIAVLFICVGLSGCTDISNPFDSEGNRFIGTWKTDLGITTQAITLFSDGTGSLGVCH